MPRLARSSLGGYCYHVMNRSNNQGVVFVDDEDYATFLRAMQYAHARLPMRVLGFCLMPDHFHLVLWPQHDGDLSRWMHWLTNTHVRRRHKRYKTSGHLWQGRFKAFPAAADQYLLALLRFVESNAQRAGLVERVEMWQWSSTAWWLPDADVPRFASMGPVPRGHDWLDSVRRPLPAEEMSRILESVQRSRPLGDESWMQETAERMGLEPTLRPRGRPRASTIENSSGRD